jgi:NAD(P)-dependent dehydrogenase (short-subunit alcohol dehydrogenase family)
MKSVLITGASRGIGRELALAFGRSGYAVAVNYHKEQAAAETVVQAIWESGNHEAAAFGCDVRDSLKVREMVAAIVVRWKHLDVLVNNAGLTRDRTILKMTNGEWNDVIETNLSGAFWCLREAARVMKEQKAGAIINIASILAVRGGFGNANYAASKAGLIALTKTAARELGRFKICVNAVLPGFHATDMAAHLTEEQRAKVLSESVLGQSTAMPDLTRVILEVAQNSSISGQVINVDSRVLA